MCKQEYIFQEILEQEAIAARHRVLPPPTWPPFSGKVLVTGAGDSHCAALFGRWFLEGPRQAAGLPALAASQAARLLGPGDLLIGISVSGRTLRVIEAARRALAAGAGVVAVTDDSSSPLAQLASTVWPIHASPQETLCRTSYRDADARQYVGYHHDVAQTKTFWAVLLTLVRAAQIGLDWDVLLADTRSLLAESFYQPLMRKGAFWAESGQTFFLGSGWAKIAARFASYKMYEYNRSAHFTGLEEYCHTHYFVTRPGDTVAFLVVDPDGAARAAEIVPVLQELFAARIIWIQPRSLAAEFPDAPHRDHVHVVLLPANSRPVEQSLHLVLALEWLTYCIGRVGAPDINTFHAGYDTERLVAGTLRTIRRSALRVPESTSRGRSGSGHSP
jgi:fructoselysine-6-P-deglycase FrlB-like protein